MGSGRLLMPSSVGEETIYMAELREAHLRYLLAIYALGRNDPDVGTQAVAKALNCSKASVTKMMGSGQTWREPCAAVLFGGTSEK